jgi:hypothetical protein
MRGNGGGRTLGVLLPGLGYTCDMPVMYYAQNLLESLGADVFRMEYRYGVTERFTQANESDQEDWIRDDVTNAYGIASEQGDYTEVIFVAKSIGTKALSLLLSSGKLDVAMTKSIWLTPLLGNPHVCKELMSVAGRSLVVISAGESALYSAQACKLAPKLGSSWVVINRVDHGLDVTGDVAASIEALGVIVRSMRQFLQAS